MLIVLLNTLKNGEHPFFLIFSSQMGIDQQVQCMGIPPIIEGLISSVILSDIVPILGKKSLEGSLLTAIGNGFPVWLWLRRDPYGVKTKDKGQTGQYTDGSRY